MRGKFTKGILTVFGAVLLSTLGIFAADSLTGVDRNLVGLVGVGTENGCVEGSVLMKRGDVSLCIDLYEASVSESCQHALPKSLFETEENIQNEACFAASKPEASPWRFVSLPQAERLCARSGKRLPTSEEWYDFTIGTTPGGCVINARSPQETGTESCVSSVGVYDGVGNVWEWVDETVHNRTYNERELPPEGYVASVDSAGVAITATSTEQTLYGNDYFWSKAEGTFGMIRGGFYGSGEDAGLYAVNASLETSFGSQGIGFRCVKDL